MASGSTVELTVEGMHCAACAVTVEKSLNALDGVEALGEPRDRAGVRALSDRRSTSTISSGRSRAPATARTSRSPTSPRRPSPLRLRLIVAVALTAPLVAISMIPALHFAGWEWVALALATPVVFWCGAGFHRAALSSLRHRAATMDTLVSLGTLAAWVWSVVVLVAVDSSGHVLRGRRRRHDADPAGPVPGDAGQAPLGRCVALARQARRQGGARAARRRRGRDSRRGARHRRPVRRASRREARRGRRRRGRRLRARPVDADRRAGSRGGRTGREGGRRDDQHLGAARRDRNPQSARTPRSPRSRGS